MEIYFRELEAKDIPAIREISKDIWEGEDYIPTVIEEWLLDKNSYNYGGFSDKEKRNLIGFGRVNFFSEIAWLEGGRVKKSLQKQGIGRELMRHAIEYAKKAGSKIAQYDTSSENKGSLALADYFGFREKDSMHVLELDLESRELNFNNIDSKIGIQELSYDQVFPIYKKIEDGPREELNIGWSFIPLRKKFLKGKKWRWNSTSKAIIQYYNMDWELIEKEIINELRLIVYGNENDALDLIKYTLSEELTRDKYDVVELFCRSNIVENVKKIGFSYPDYNSTEDRILKVILFEKDLENKN
jgi:GNAT superfamily N-acetyltransferase